MTQQVSAQQKHNAEQEVSGGIDDAGEQPPAFVDRYSINCANCGKSVDEHDFLHNPHGEVEVCTKCLAARDEVERLQIITAARAQYAREGSIEIDQGAAFSRGEEDGLYVAAWVWLPWSVKALPDQTDDLFCVCDHDTSTHTEGNWRDCGEICDECGRPLPFHHQSAEFQSNPASDA